MVTHILKSELIKTDLVENRLQQIFKSYYSLGKHGVSSDKAALPSSGGLQMSLLVQDMFSKVVFLAGLHCSKLT